MRSFHEKMEKSLKNEAPLPNPCNVWFIAWNAQSIIVKIYKLGTTARCTGENFGL